MIWFKRKRKQCKQCLRTFYKPYVWVEGCPYGGEWKRKDCPHCGHWEWVIV